MRKAIRDHRTDFVALIVLFVFGMGTTIFILSQQQAPYPSWLPILGDDTVELKAELSTAQAVTPGQGQTVNIAGIEVGNLTDVTLEGGEAVVTMQVEREYASLIHSDATVLMRPRTGLQDQTLEVDPGTDEAPPIEDGDTLPSSQTEPNINPDEILASLDGDTQAYLRLLLEGGAEGLGGHGREFSAALRRFEPLGRDLAKINGKLSHRNRNIERSIHNFRLVSEELGDRDTRLAEFVDSNNAVLESFANQEASLRESLQELPSALAATRGALESGDQFALELGPASRALIPQARSLGPALEATRPFFRDTVAPIRDQIRPFTREVRPSIRELADTATALNKATPKLTSSVGELNALFNALAFDPSGSGESYLYYVPWLNHNLNSALGFQDAQGPFLRTIVLQSCLTSNLAEGFAVSRPYIRTLQQLSRVPVSGLSQTDPDPNKQLCTLDPPF
jgi:phospholipid/cholesterol/gamma-HCH transport system substrate-binding protein